MLFYRHLGQVICAVFKFSGQQSFIILKEAVSKVHFHAKNTKKNAKSAKFMILIIKSLRSLCSLRKTLCKLCVR
jgi:hypothetical protein